MKLVSLTTKRHLAYALALAVSFFVVSATFVFAQQNPDPASAFNQGIQQILWSFVARVFGWIVGIAGIVLNYSINEFITGFGQLYVSGGVGGAVDSVWEGVRDMFNLTFIFALVYLGFKMILNSDDSGTRKWLANIIMAALLVNFSLFITKFIVDLTNMLAFELLEAFPSGDISGTFMSIFGIPNVLDWNQRTEAQIQGNQGYMYIFGVAIIFLVTAFTFMAGAIMIMIRFIALNLYMAMSPLMFLGWVLPQFQSVTSKYWSGFLGKAFYAPVYILMLYFSFLVLAAISQTANSSGGTLATAINGQGGNVEASVTGPLVGFILGIGFLIATIQVANKMSMEGAGTVIKIGNNLRGRAQRAVTNTALYAPRRVARATVGDASNQLRRFDNKLIASNTLSAKTARAALGAVGLDARTRDKLIEQGRNAKMGTNYSTADNEKNRLKQQARANTQQDINSRAEKLEEGRKKLLAAANGTEAERDEARNIIAAAVRKMSTDELHELGQENLQKKYIATHLTDSQLKDLGESGAYTRDGMKAIGKAREDGTFNRFDQSLNNTSASAQELEDSLEALARTVRGLSGDKLTSISFDRINSQAFASNLSDKQIDTLRDSGKFTTSQIESIKKTRKNAFNSIAQTGGIQITDSTGTTRTVVPNIGQGGNKASDVSRFQEKQRRQLFGQSAQDAGKLPVDVFTNPNMVDLLTPQALQQRVRNGGMTENDRQIIENNIKAHINNSSTPNRVKKMWLKWSHDTTEGSNFDFS